MMSLMIIIGVPLAITIVIEECLSFALGKRGLSRVLAVAAVNLATNPVLNFILYIIRLYMPVPQTGLIVLLLEAAVVLIEWRIYAYLFPEDRKGSLAYSLILNASSYLIGLVLI